MRAAYPDLLIGPAPCSTASRWIVAAGADFIVSPGFNPTTVQYCLDKDVTIIPGVNNPSLVEQAMEMGLRHLKFFPAEQSGGTAMLKALGAVYPVRFMPTGGVTPANLKEYLGLNAVTPAAALDGAGQAHRRGQVGRAGRPGKRGRGGPVIIG
jgi:2-dehydro-3-deoxyphosphogluconate aldolase/(4S)-4-hydroxy-2-oxoglutarate aldolase